MPRIPFADIDSAPDSIREAIAVAPLGLFRMVAHAQSAFDAWLTYLRTLLTRLELDPLLRELTILQVAHLAGSQYVWGQHVPVALASGGTDEQVQVIESDRVEHKSFSEEQRMLLRFTREVVLDGAASEQALSELARRLGPRQVVEVLLVIGQYLSIARLIASTGVEPDPPTMASSMIDHWSEHAGRSA